MKLYRVRLHYINGANKYIILTTDYPVPEPEAAIIARDFLKLDHAVKVELVEETVILFKGWQDDEKNRIRVAAFNPPLKEEACGEFIPFSLNSGT